MFQRYIEILRRKQYKEIYNIFHGAIALSEKETASHYRGFTITLRQTTLGRTPLNVWLARRRVLYLTTHYNHKRDIHVPVGFEPAIPASELPQNHASTARPLGQTYIILLHPILHAKYWKYITELINILYEYYGNIADIVINDIQITTFIAANIYF
jgi:hypothetical protein